MVLIVLLFVAVAEVSLIDYRDQIAVREEEEEVEANSQQQLQLALVSNHCETFPDLSRLLLDCSLQSINNQLIQILPLSSIRS